MPDVTNCVACILKVYFTEYSRNPSNLINVSGLQKLLSLKDPIFQYLEQADAMEALSSLLVELHRIYTDGKADDSCGGNCPAHRAFSIGIFEEIVCECGQIMDGVEWDYCTFFQPFYAENVVSDHLSILSVISSFPKYLNVSTALVVEVECRKDCKFAVKRKLTYIQYSPEVFVVNVIWKSSQISMLDSLLLIASLPDYLNIRDIYRVAQKKHYRLKGLLMYSSSHYISYLLENDNMNWHKLDDGITKTAGSKFSTIQDIIKGKMHVVGVFYEVYEDITRMSVISQGEWLDLERMAIESDDFSNPQILPTDLDEEEANQQAALDSVAWICACGSVNPQIHLVCALCNQQKKLENEWECDKCTFSNCLVDIHCKLCKHPQKSLKTSFSKGEWSRGPVSWVCFCGQEENTEPTCRTCSRDKKLLRNCFSCSEVFGTRKYCSSCNGKIRSEGFCVRCLDTSRSAICSLCSKLK